MTRAQLLAACFLAFVACSHPGVPQRTALRDPRVRVPTSTTFASRAPLALPVDVTGAGSPVVLAHVRDVLVAYVADADDGVVRAFDADHLSELSVLDVGGSPAELVLTQGRLFASLRDRNTVVAIEGSGTDGDPMRVVTKARAPAEPIGVAVTPDGATLLVVSGWGHALSAYATDTLEQRFSADVGREPRAVLVSDDGMRAFVSHAVGSDIDVVDLKDPSSIRHVSVKATEALGSGRFFAGEFEMQGGQGFALARSVAPAGRIYAPHARIRPVLVEGFEESEASAHYGSFELGPTEEFDVGVLDEDTGAPVQTSLDTNGGLSCVLPRAAAATRAGEVLVACMGTGEVIAMDAAAANPHGAVTTRWSVPAGPQGIAVDDDSERALVWSELAHALTWIPLAAQGGFVLASSTLARRVAMAPEVERGRVLFHTTDARISEDGRACASCHPDGRDDGLVWATPDGPRNPPMLAGRLEHAAPYGWLGSTPTVAGHLKKTLGRLGGKGLPDADRDALVAYLKAMKPPPVDPADGTGVADVADGKRIFESEEAGCTSCHGDDGASPDGLTHNVRSWANRDVRGDFDTPSLRFIGGTAPYFHDGRYASLRALLEHTQGAMGQKKRLSARERDALEAYVRSL
jgi:DNA-binding beta-propeller fold protein YncE/mono/diheme cytochrome c family protein